MTSIPTISAIQRHQPPVLFIADLHLDPARPDIRDAFVEFCDRTAPAAGAVYILGDLFEVWIGDDDDTDAWQPVFAALRRLVAAGVTVRFLPGNRDFLAGAGFAERSGVICLPDPTRIDLFGRPTLLCHGDLLCTDDIDHQEFRRRVQDEAWRSDFLARPLAERRQIARRMRAGSRDSVSDKAEALMDVNVETVTDVMRRAGVSLLIHGHTHRPDRHLHWIDGARVERWVLGDWYEQASMLVADRDGLRRQTLMSISP